MTSFARGERQALCDTFLDVGPDVPTLCPGWATRDLAAHLVVRERRPDAQVGMFVAALAGHTASVQDEVAGGSWTALVDQVRSGPPLWHPARLGVVDEATNLAEFFVHHEDVLRAQPGWQPRQLGPELETALWRVCGTIGRLTLRRVDVGVELVWPEHGRAAVRRGHPTVRVAGRPGELLLFAFGRRAVAQVDLDGPSSAVAQLRAAPAGQ